MLRTAETNGWLDASAFPFLRALESAAAPIEAELGQLLGRSVWSLWGTRQHTPTFTRMSAEQVTETLQRTQTRIGEGARAAWKLFGLYLQGAPLKSGCRLCPDTARVLRGVPGLINAGFSCLEAGYAIPPHVGHDPRLYRAHLGLIVPAGDCGLAVDGTVRGWVPGKTLIFDDTHRHTAWNKTAEHRFVLIVDVARSEHQP